MNTELVNSLVKLIHSLPPEEQDLLREKLDKKQDWQMVKDRIIQRGKVIQQRQGNQWDDAIDEIFYEMREERSQELLKACLPELEN